MPYDGHTSSQVMNCFMVMILCVRYHVFRMIDCAFRCFSSRVIAGSVQFERVCRLMIHCTRGRSPDKMALNHQLTSGKLDSVAFLASLCFMCRHGTNYIYNFPPGQLLNLREIKQKNLYNSSHNYVSQKRFATSKCQLYNLAMMS